MYVYAGCAYAQARAGPRRQEREEYEDDVLDKQESNQDPRRPWLRRPKSLSFSKRQMHVLRRRGHVRWNSVLPFLFEIPLPQLLPSDAARAVPRYAHPATSPIACLMPTLQCMATARVGMKAPPIHPPGKSTTNWPAKPKSQAFGDLVWSDVYHKLFDLSLNKTESDRVDKPYGHTRCAGSSYPQTARLCVSTQ